MVIEKRGRGEDKGRGMQKAGDEEERRGKGKEKGMKEEDARKR